MPPPDGGYRDRSGRLKRQAAQFRIYGYDQAGNVVAELTADHADIVWEVHVANKKAAWYDFDFALDLPEAASSKSARRNASIQGKRREELIIDPKARRISGRDDRSQPFDTGSFLGSPIYLGELRTDQQGRLLFLGGKGKSASPLGYGLTTFANNPGWHDDTSDGPVRAMVKIGNRSIPVDPAWVVTAPPNYAPDIVSPQTMYDVIRDAIGKLMLPKTTRVSFRNDILPLLKQCVDTQWVNAGFLAMFGWQSPNEFLRPDYLRKLAAAPVGGDPYRELRYEVLLSFRNPDASTFEPRQWPPIYGDAFGSFDSPPGPRVGFAVTRTLYQALEQWASGNFEPDYDENEKEPESLDDLPLTDQPVNMDRAALHFCMGGPFHPGCEMTWPMRRYSMYQQPFRLRERAGDDLNLDYGDFLTTETALALDGPLSASGPGDITKWMAVPWQSDTDSCRAGYPNTEFPDDTLIPTFWPSRVPNTILAEDEYRIAIDQSQPLDARLRAFYTRVNWLRNLKLDDPTIVQLEAMVERFGQQGVVERREHDAGPEFPQVMYVETVPSAETRIKPARVTAAAAADMHRRTVSEEFASARFPRFRH
jgi:hypothetical protein